MTFESRRLKFLVRIKASNVDKKSVEGHDPVRLCNYVDVYNNDLITGDLQFMQATATPAQINAFTLRRGDIIITKDSEAPDDIGIPAYVPENLADVVCGYHLSILRPDIDVIVPKFLFWTLQSQQLKWYFNIESKGVTRFALGYDEIGNAPIPLPSLELQESIALFLDKETSRIDRITGNARLLNDTDDNSPVSDMVRKLLEYRSAVITAAVTGQIEVAKAA